MQNPHADPDQRQKLTTSRRSPVGNAYRTRSTSVTEIVSYENLYSPHNSDSSSDKIDTKLYNKDTKNKLN